MLISRESSALSAITKRIDIVSTTYYSSAMKMRSRTVDQSPSPAPARGKKSTGSINLRIETKTRQLIDDAAATLGKTRTDFMVASARQVAIDVLLDQRLFVLEPDAYDAFVKALDRPPAPGPRLRALLRRTPAWKS